MTMKDHAASAARPARAGAYRTILWIGLVAGTLDIAENLILNLFRQITPTMVFQYIASGLLGMRAFQAGWASVALGVGLHYFIALTWTVVFYLASRTLTVMLRRPVVSGLVYGGIAYGFINWVVLPWSGVPHAAKPMSVASRISGVLALLFCIGLTISLLTRKYLATE